MIVKSGNPLSPSVSFSLNGVEVNYSSITRMSLDLGVNKHDVLTLIMDGIPHKAITDYEGAAVQFKISSGQGRTQEFNGYVMYVEPEHAIDAPLINGSAFYTAKIVCFGASVSMKTVRQKVYENTKIYKIAQDIARENKFSLDVIQDEFVIPRAVQASESDWEFLNKICLRYGYSFTVHGTHMRVWDPFQAVDKKPSFELLTPVTAISDGVPGSIIRMTGTFGTLTVDGNSYRYQLTSLDNSGTLSTNYEKGQVTTWSGDTETPKYSTIIPDSATSIAEARKMIDAERRKTFPYNARVDVVAGAGIVPGGIVEISGYKSDIDGLWYVKSVRHNIGGTTYTTELEVGKDRNTYTIFTTAPTTLYATAPEAVFVDNEWRASQNKVVLYA
jgi:phage protein D